MSESITLEEWSDLSEQGEVCGVFGCEDNLLSECPYCDHYYCETHKGMHLLTHSEN